MEKDLHFEFYNWMIGCDVSGSVQPITFRVGHANAKTGMHSNRLIQQ